MSLSPVLCSSEVLRAVASIHRGCRAAAPGRGYTKTRECLKHSLDLAQQEVLQDLCRKRTLRAPTCHSPPRRVWNSAGSLAAAGDGSTDWALPVQRSGPDGQAAVCLTVTLLNWEFCSGSPSHWTSLKSTFKNAVLVI